MASSVRLAFASFVGPTSGSVNVLSVCLPLLSPVLDKHKKCSNAQTGLKRFFFFKYVKDNYEHDMQCVVHMILRKGKISVALVFSHHKEKLILVTRSNGNHSILDFAFICHCLVLTVYGHFAFKCVVFLTLDTVLGVGVVCFSA